MTLRAGDVHKGLIANKVAARNGSKSNCASLYVLLMPIVSCGSACAKQSNTDNATTAIMNLCNASAIALPLSQATTGYFTNITSAILDAFDSRVAL